MFNFFVLIYFKNINHIIKLYTIFLNDPFKKISEVFLMYVRSDLLAVQVNLGDLLTPSYTLRG